jgi:hypothetical protein
MANRSRRLTVPRILVTADGSDGRETAVVLQERVVPTDLESNHHAARLVERVGLGFGRRRRDRAEDALASGTPDQIEGEA